MVLELLVVIHVFYGINDRRADIKMVSDYRPWSPATPEESQIFSQPLNSNGKERN